MSDEPSLKLPPWLISIVVGIFVSMFSLVFAAGQALQRLNEQERRLENIEKGIDQLWDRAMSR